MDLGGGGMGSGSTGEGGPGGDGGRLDEGVVESTVDRAARLPVSTDLELVPIEAQPAFLNPPNFVSVALGVSAVVIGANTGAAGARVDGFAILIPAALASFRSSFSSRLRSFSFLFSTSSWSTGRALACISRRRALW